MSTCKEEIRTKGFNEIVEVECEKNLFTICVREPKNTSLKLCQFNSYETVISGFVYQKVAPVIRLQYYFRSRFWKVSLEIPKAY